MNLQSERDLGRIFERSRALLAAYHPRLDVRRDEPRRYDVRSERELEVPVGRHRWRKMADPRVVMRTRKASCSPRPAIGRGIRKKNGWV